MLLNRCPELAILVLKCDPVFAAGCLSVFFSMKAAKQRNGQNTAKMF